MEWHNGVLNYLTDDKNKLSHKSLVVVAILIIIVILDNTLNFSNSFVNYRKLEQIEKINNILKDTSLNDIEREILTKSRLDVINHKTLFQKTYDYFSSFNFRTNSEDLGKSETGIVEIKSNERIYWVHLLTSSWIYIVFGLIVLVQNFKKYKPLWENIVSSVITIVYMASISWLTAKTLSSIPVVIGRPYINYVINIVLVPFIIFLILQIVKYVERVIDK